jgi:hypothetical protein
VFACGRGVRLWGWGSSRRQLSRSAQPRGTPQPTSAAGSSCTAPGGSCTATGSTGALCSKPNTLPAMTTVGRAEAAARDSDGKMGRRAGLSLSSTFEATAAEVAASRSRVERLTVRSWANQPASAAATASGHLSSLAHRSTVRVPTPATPAASACVIPHDIRRATSTHSGHRGASSASCSAWLASWGSSGALDSMPNNMRISQAS